MSSYSAGDCGWKIMQGRSYSKLIRGFGALAKSPTGYKYFHLTDKLLSPVLGQSIAQQPTALGAIWADKRREWKFWTFGR
jgi:hypothetical protein